MSVQGNFYRYTPGKQHGAVAAYNWFRQQSLSTRAKQTLAIASAISHGSEGNVWGVLRSLGSLPTEKRIYRRRRRSRQPRRSSSSRRRSTSKTSKSGYTNKHNTKKRYRQNLGYYHGSHHRPKNRAEAVASRARARARASNSNEGRGTPRGPFKHPKGSWFHRNRSEPGGGHWHTDEL